METNDDEQLSMKLYGEIRQLIDTYKDKGIQFYSAFFSIFVLVCEMSKAIAVGNDKPKSEWKEILKGAIDTIE